MESLMPLVSVIMNCHNCAKYLREALDSVYQQIFKDYEIIFWDNVSTDNSAEIALSYGEPLRYFRGMEFLPLGAARNAAIEKARGKYLAFLDCDDIWLPEKLEEQVKRLDSHEELGLVYSDCYLIDENGNFEGDTLLSSLKLFRGNVFDKLFLNNFIPMPTVMIRRTTLGEVGIFNPKYEIAEEYDLWLRIAEHYPIDFTEEPLAKYRIHGGSVSRNRELAVNEGFQLIEYWLEKKANLERGFRGKAKQRQAILNASLMLYYFGNGEKRKVISKSMNLIRLFPYSLVLVPMVIARLRHVLNPRRNSWGRM
jgi:glycosyltransferase involved in cell wall biosynthesis